MTNIVVNIFWDRMMYFPSEIKVKHDVRLYFGDDPNSVADRMRYAVLLLKQKESFLSARRVADCVHDHIYSSSDNTPFIQSIDDIQIAVKNEQGRFYLSILNKDGVVDVPAMELMRQKIIDDDKENKVPSIGYYECSIDYDAVVEDGRFILPYSVVEIFSGALEKNGKCLGMVLVGTCNTVRYYDESVYFHSPHLQTRRNNIVRRLSIEGCCSGTSKLDYYACTDKYRFRMDNDNTKEVWMISGPMTNPYDGTDRQSHALLRLNIKPDFGRECDFMVKCRINAMVIGIQKKCAAHFANREAAVNRQEKSRHLNI